MKVIKEQNRLQLINWELLLFLVCFLNVKLLVKVFAIIIICLLNKKHLFRATLLQNRLLIFYMLMIVIAVINVFLQAGLMSVPYLIGAGVGMVFWLLAALASWLCFRYVEKEDPVRIHSTITLFFLLNVLITVGTLLRIIIETGAINPYTFQGMYQKYFIMTGDYMRGISFDTSTTNALLNAFGVVYFINRQKALLTLLCMAGLLLTASNLTSLLLMSILAYIFIFQSNRDQKSLILVCFFLLVIFSAKISPQNKNYVQSTLLKIAGKNRSDKPGVVPNVDEIIQKPDSLLGSEDRKRKFARLYLDSVEKVKREREVLSANKLSAVVPADKAAAPEAPVVDKPDIPRPDIHSRPFQRNKDSTPLQKELFEFAKKEKKDAELLTPDTGKNKLPGKVIALKQTLDFLRIHPRKILTGNGIGNFSSKLAFRTTGLNIAGGYPSKFIYINNDFRDNHLAVFLYYFSRDAGLHSVIHSPNAVYYQILGEYGLVGLVVFLLFYMGFFVRNRKYLTYGIPLLMIIAGAFFIEYWFEQLSIVVLFELLLFLDIRENKERLMKYE